MTTAMDIITDAFSNINESESEAAIESVDAQLALRELNRMMAALLTNVGWTKAATLTSTLTTRGDLDDYLVKALAKRLAGHYEIPVSAQLQEDFKAAKRSMLSKYVKIEPSQYPSTLPNPYGYLTRNTSGYSDPDKNSTGSRTSKTITSDYTIVLADDLILADCTDVPVVITLPGVAASTGYGFSVQKIDDTPNLVIIQTVNSELIFNHTSYATSTYMEIVDFTSYGTAWQ